MWCFDEPSVISCILHSCGSRSTQPLSGQRRSACAKSGPAPLVDVITLMWLSAASKVDKARWTCRADKKAVRQTISASSQPDLFWGMRGAGGSLGVAIEYSTYAFEVPNTVCITAPPALLPLKGIEPTVHWIYTDTAVRPKDCLSMCKPPLSLHCREEHTKSRLCAECGLKWLLQVQSAAYTFKIAIAQDVLTW